MPILKLKRHNEEREINFELQYLKSLSLSQRFLFMLRKSREMKFLLKDRGYRKTVKIIKRNK